jgi:hypothetical protein
MAAGSSSGSSGGGGGMQRKSVVFAGSQRGAGGPPAARNTAPAPAQDSSRQADALPPAWQPSGLPSAAGHSIAGSNWTRKSMVNLYGPLQPLPGAPGAAGGGWEGGGASWSGGMGQQGNTTSAYHIPSVLKRILDSEEGRSISGRLMHDKPDMTNHQVRGIQHDCAGLHRQDPENSMGRLPLKCATGAGAVKQQWAQQPSACLLWRAHPGTS